MSLAITLGVSLLLLGPAGQVATQRAPQSTPTAAVRGVQLQSATPSNVNPTHPARLHAKKKTQAKPLAATPANVSPIKRVVANGGTSDVASRYAPTANRTEPSVKRSDADHLLDAADMNLHQLSDRQLTSSDQEMLRQVRTYMDQARGAVAKGEFDRGKNLASKANQLSAELIKH
ncbi:MAG: hypothetical protein H0X25_17380 [Acidobacteriales bacterium]|nr:hypothetical protein [Terriglobales bacterium]